MKRMGEKFQGIGIIGVLLFGCALDGSSWLAALGLVIISALLFGAGCKIKDFEERRKEL